MPGNEHHTSKQFDAELEVIRSRVLQMGGLVEQQTLAALDALDDGSIQLARRVIEDDHRVNGLEVQIDEECNTVIAKRQPAASDLRLLMTVVKTITDLERIGDEATKIARMTQLIYESDRPMRPRGLDVRHMADAALDMLRTSLDAFARLDVNAATGVLRKDEAVDDEFRSIIRQLITYVMEDPRTISHAMEMLFIAKAIERIGDHAKNISEYVIYMVKGKDVRHTNIEDIEREVLAQH
jgi:phosphate transport system protein